MTFLFSRGPSSIHSRILGSIGITEKVDAGYTVLTHSCGNWVSRCDLGNFPFADQSPRAHLGSLPRGWMACSNQQGQNGRWLLTQSLVSILRRAGAAHLTEHARKVLLCFEPARHSNIKNPHLGVAQHLFCTLYSLPQDKLMRAFAGRLPKRLQEMRRAEPCTLGHFVKG